VFLRKIVEEKEESTAFNIPQEVKAQANKE
jgi:hypothetical protein